MIKQVFVHVRLAQYKNKSIPLITLDITRAMAAAPDARAVLFAGGATVAEVSRAVRKVRAMARIMKYEHPPHDPAHPGWVPLLTLWNWDRRFQQFSPQAAVAAMLQDRLRHGQPRWMFWISDDNKSAWVQYV